MHGPQCPHELLELGSRTSRGGLGEKAAEVAAEFADFVGRIARFQHLTGDHIDKSAVLAGPALVAVRKSDARCCIIIVDLPGMAFGGICPIDPVEPRIRFACSMTK